MMCFLILAMIDNGVDPLDIFICFMHLGMKSPILCDQKSWWFHDRKTDFMMTKTFHHSLNHPLPRAP